MSILIHYFSDKIVHLTFAEKHIFYYIDSNLEQAKVQSLTAMAAFNNVSTTTIVRMCTKLGLSGFSELKYILKSLPSDTPPPIDDYILNLKNNLNLSLDRLSLERIHSLVHLIKSTQKIIIVSVGLSKPMGEYFSKLLMQANKSSFYIYESHIINLLDQSASPDDLIIFISNSGETSTLLSIAEKLNYRNFKTAAIVNSPDSSLSKLVTTSINSYSDKGHLNGYDVTPRSTMLIILDIVFAYYINDLN